MTPQEESKDLIQKFNYESKHFLMLDAKECALIAVDMVIRCCKDYDEVHENYTTQVDHWQEVKQEIEKL